MQRDLDLARQILFDLEAHGPECTLTTLRPNLNGVNHQLDERMRYHLRLLVDAGLVKEVERTSAGAPCVRLTNSGHELLELARSESQWREAKRLCRERTGGLSLAVVRTLLVKWAVQATVSGLDAPRRRPAIRHYREERREFPQSRAERVNFEYDTEQFSATRPRYKQPAYYQPTYIQPSDYLANSSYPTNGYTTPYYESTGYRPDYRETFAWTDAEDRSPRYVTETYHTPVSDEIGVTLPIYVV